MKKRIYRSMALLSLAGLLIFGILVSLLFYQVTAQTAIHDVQEKASLLSTVTDDGEDSLTRIAPMGDPAVDVRVTLLSPSGDVLFDNATSAPLENHASREEYQEAMALGVGESQRFSSTLGALMYYYALRLPDGNVLRLAKPIARIVDILWRMAPLLAMILLAVFGLSNIAATRLARRIIQPLQQEGLDGADPVYDELSPLIRTIAKQKQRLSDQDDSLARQVDTLRTIVSAMQEGFILLDSRGKALMVSPSALALLGVPPGAEGRSIIELVRHLELLEHVKAALAGDRREATFSLGRRSLRGIFSPMPEGGAMILLMDITRQLQAEKTRQEFSANVSHELKTPLTSIRGYAEMLHQGLSAPQDVVRFAGKIEEEAKRLYALVEDVMKLSEMDEATAIPERTAVDVAHTAQEVLEALSARARECNVSVVCTGALTLPFQPAMLHEMLYNLVDNGIKYNKPGGEVRVALSKGPGGATVTVTDTGMGIAPEHLDHIFERFYRVDKSRSKKSGGTGLGLAIVKHIALLHGGTVSIQSQEGQGTTITFSFPHPGASNPG